MNTFLFPLSRDLQALPTHGDMGTNAAPGWALGFRGDSGSRSGKAGASAQAPAKASERRRLLFSHCTNGTNQAVPTLLMPRDRAFMAACYGGDKGGRELVPSACWAPVWQQGRKYRVNVRTSAHLNFRNGCDGNSCHVYFTTIYN